MNTNKQYSLMVHLLCGRELGFRNCLFATIHGVPNMGDGRYLKVSASRMKNDFVHVAPSTGLTVCHSVPPIINDILDYLGANFTQNSRNIMSSTNIPFSRTFLTNLRIAPSPSMYHMEIMIDNTRSNRIVLPYATSIWTVFVDKRVDIERLVPSSYLHTESLDKKATCTCVVLKRAVWFASTRDAFAIADDKCATHPLQQRY
ncbi:hypothetical protein G5I_07851 [Acromyrmex echinatior]|uniref:Uncharacterized protein n=1 Tax=Acromyrmex echinatior TaxID=103372 RepID=F4WPX4_ACREC|nr:hypothetical protein G5I_07851 [Acromyrmex echinatior]